MSRHYGEGRCDLPVCYRNAGVGRHRDSRANAGNDLERDFSIGQRLRLFPAATKNERIAALETHNLVTKPGVVDEYSVDFFLSDAMASGLLADKNPDGRGRRLFEKLKVHQLIVNDHLSAMQQLQSADRDQARISRPRAHEINFARSHSLAPNVSSRSSFARTSLPSLIKRRKSPCSARFHALAAGETDFFCNSRRTSLAISTNHS